MSQPFTVYEVRILSGVIIKHTAIAETDKQFVLAGGRRYGKDTKWSVIRRDKREAIDKTNSVLADRIAERERDIQRIRNTMAMLEANK